jgi:hypothetical protein
MKLEMIAIIATAILFALPPASPGQEKPEEVRPAGRAQTSPVPSS